MPMDMRELVPQKLVVDFLGMIDLRSNISHSADFYD